MNSRGRIVWAALAVLAAAGAAAAADWPQWRGPFFNGSTTETDLPERWGPAENVAWAADLPGPSGATPIVWGDHVFVSSADGAAKRTWAIALDRRDGRLLWKHETPGGFSNRQGNTAASPSPVTDGRRVVFTYGTGRMLACDFDGRVLWRRDIPKDHGEFETMWGYGSSPLLLQDRLYLPVLHGDHTRDEGVGESYLLAIAAADGKDVWKHVRPMAARRESRQAYTTPCPLETAGGAQVVLAGGDCVTGHAPGDGRELWRSPPYNPGRITHWRTVVSPVAAAGLVVAAAPKGGGNFAVRIGPTGEAMEGWAWTLKENSPDVCTPLVYNGRMYILDGRAKVLQAVEPATGRVLWRGDLGGKAVFQASPTGADGRIYCINLAGEAVVLAAGEEFKVLARIEMGGSGCRSSIAAARGRLYVRTDTKLFAVGYSR
jgi:outer membrane protein assembly factor BamB